VFYEFPESDKLEEEQEEKRMEFWNKTPSCFRQSTDDPSRMIFRAGTRSHWIFDLHMLEG
jgi:hypothetical protein